MFVNQELQQKITETKRKYVWQDLAVDKKTKIDTRNICINSFEKDERRQAENVDGSTVSSGRGIECIHTIDAEPYDDTIAAESIGNVEIRSQYGNDRDDTSDDGRHSPNISEVIARGEDVSADICTGSDRSIVSEPWSTIFARIEEHPFRPYLVHDTIRYSCDEERDRLVEQFDIRDRSATAFTNNKFDQPFFCIADHDAVGFQHLHILHDCRWISRRCACSRFSWYTRSNRLRKPTPIGQIQSEDWYRIVSYLSSGSRRIVQIHVGGRLWRYPPRYTYIPVIDDSERREEELVEILFAPRTSCRSENSFRGPSGGSSIARHAEPRRQTARQVRGKREDTGATDGNFVQQVIQLIKNTCSAPLERCFELDVWALNTKFMFYRPQDRVIDTAMIRARNEINKWSTADFVLHYLNVTPLFYCRTSDEFSKEYMSISHTVLRLLELLFFQFKRSKHVIDFLQTLKSVCDCDNGKYNSVFILGESNAGKTQFADALCCFYLNRVMMRNPTKQERFSFMECAQRRIIFWDEAKLDPGQYDNIKRLLAGDNCVVAVKFKSDQTVYKTPIIICSNNSIFPLNDEFQNRVLSYRWFSYPLWRRDEIKLRFNPIAIGVLLSWSVQCKRVSNSVDFNIISNLFIQVIPPPTATAYT